jgi:NADH:ubiquinone oxidoreductase subunit 3 (subunit A)
LPRLDGWSRFVFATVCEFLHKVAADHLAATCTHDRKGWAMLPVQTAAGLEPAFDLAAYYPALVYAIIVVGLALSTLAAVHLPLIKPNKPTKVKLMPYESGMDPIGSSRMQTDIRFHLIAILFLVFDVELLFLYPWAVIAFADGADSFWKSIFGGIVFIEILIFLPTLGIAYVYAWRKGVFQWR